MDAKYFDGRKITIGIRSEDLYYDDKLVENNPQLSIKVKAQVIEELGAETLVNANVIGTADNIIFKTKILQQLLLIKKLVFMWILQNYISLI